MEALRALLLCSQASCPSPQLHRAGGTGDGFLWLPGVSSARVHIAASKRQGDPPQWQFSCRLGRTALHWLPKTPCRVRLQVPAVELCWLTSLSVSHPCRCCLGPKYTTCLPSFSWNLLPGKNPNQSSVQYTEQRVGTRKNINPLHRECVPVSPQNHICNLHFYFVPLSRAT